MSKYFKTETSREIKLSPEKQMLFDRLYDGLEESTLESNLQKLPIPQLHKEGGKKFIWKNFGKTCEILNRPQKQLQNFIGSETGDPTSINQNGELTLTTRSRMNSQKFESLIKKFIKQSVMCKTCGGCKSVQTKNLVTCNICKATHAV